MPELTASFQCFLSRSSQATMRPQLVLSPIICLGGCEVTAPLKDEAGPAQSGTTLLLV